jgi:hypothetical protein
MVQVAIGLARGLDHLSTCFADLSDWQLGADANCELAGRNALEAGIGSWLPEPPGFALFGNQQVATTLKTRGFSSRKLPGDGIEWFESAADEVIAEIAKRLEWDSGEVVSRRWTGSRGTSSTPCSGVLSPKSLAFIREQAGLPID